MHSLAEAKAFPAALATYAKSDMMRLAAWITIDGMLPLGPAFIQKIVALVAVGLFALAFATTAVLLVLDMFGAFGR